MDAAVTTPRSVPPDDAEAIAAARAEFWARWRGERPSYATSRRQSAQAPAATVSPPLPRTA